MKKMSNLPHQVVNAAIFAGNAHSKQVRKYTGEPYITHPSAVCRTLYDLKIRDVETLSAAWLHDVVEDTDITLEKIRSEFGDTIALLVADLTDISTKTGGTRAHRKAIDREHLRHADPRAKNIKLADLLDNTRSIAEHDPAFALVYIPEKLALLEVLKDGSSPVLWKRAHKAVVAAMKNLNIAQIAG